MLILTKSRLELALGRFRLMVDEMAKLVQIRWVSGDAPAQDEMRNIEKFLRYKRPDIMNPNIRTGWGIECSSGPIGITVRANSEMSR